MSGKTTNQVQFDNSLLATNLEDLEDVPPIAVPPTGEYILECQIETKALAIKNGDRAGSTMNCIEFKYSVVSVIETKRAEEAEEVTPGQLFTELMELAPDRMKWHKAKMLEMNELTGTKGLQELVAAFAKPVKIQAKVVRRIDKNDDSKAYASVSDVQAA